MSRRRTSGSGKGAVKLKLYPRTRQEVADSLGWPTPDERFSWRFHTFCPACGVSLLLVVDLADGPPADVGVTCICGARPRWRVAWWYAVEVREYLGDDREASS